MCASQRGLFERPALNDLSSAAPLQFACHHSSKDARLILNQGASALNMLTLAPSYQLCKYYKTSRQ